MDTGTKTLATGDDLNDLLLRISVVEDLLGVKPPKPPAPRTDLNKVTHLGVDDGSRAVLPLGDLRVTETGQLIVHPMSSNTHPEDYAYNDSMEVERTRGGLLVTVRQETVALIDPDRHMPTDYNKGWNQVVKLTFRP